MRLAHGWRLVETRDVPPSWIGEFLRPAVRAVPRAMAARLGRCTISVSSDLDTAGASSRWARTAEGLAVELGREGMDGHDLALELLLCLGQALWATALPAEQETYWKLLGAEIEAGVTGEMDEEALQEKRALLAGRVSARSPRRFQRYARASFAATVAEYVHCLWHDVEVRSGPDYLPAHWLRRRLEMLARWFPPNRGYRLFAAKIQ